MALSGTHLLALGLYGFSVAAGYPAEGKPDFLTPAASAATKILTAVVVTYGLVTTLFSFSFGAFASWLTVLAVIAGMALVEVAVDGVKIWQIHHHTSGVGSSGPTDPSVRNADSAAETVSGTGPSSTHEDRMSELEELQSEIEDIDERLDDGSGTARADAGGFDGGGESPFDDDPFDDDSFDDDPFDDVETGDTSKRQIASALDGDPERLAAVLENADEGTTINVIDGDVVIDEHEETNVDESTDVTNIDESTDVTNVDESTSVGDDNVMNRPDIGPSDSDGAGDERD